MKDVVLFVCHLITPVILAAVVLAYPVVARAGPDNPETQPGASGAGVRRSSLGMEFRPVRGLDGVWFSKWETRVDDYRVFVEETGREWEKPDFPQRGNHPVVNVSWEDAMFFCRWLTKRERKNGRIAPDETFRLPTSKEWSKAAGLEVTVPDGVRTYHYSWGVEWPPPANSGNFGNRLGADRFRYTSPVGSFPANICELYDMEGNAREWCMDTFGGSPNLHVLRGSSWRMNTPSDVCLEVVVGNTSSLRFWAYGFRCVLSKARTAATGAGTEP